jgi:transposase
MVTQAGCEVLFLPPDSPDLNPIEKFWANFKKQVKESVKFCLRLAEAIGLTFLEICK